LKREEERLFAKNEQLIRKEEVFIEQLTTLSEREMKLHKDERELEELKNFVINELNKKSSVKKEEIEKKLSGVLKKEVENKLKNYKDQKLKITEEEIEREVTNIICLAMEKYSSEIIFEKTVNSLKIKDKEIISKIIGREGRNINAFKRITGTQIIIEKENDELNIQISSFNSSRRELALQALVSLVKKDRISPTQIKETFDEISEKFKDSILKNGQKILRDLEIENVDEEMVFRLGKLKYRTSYGQNVLEHSIEVSKIMGSIAAELRLDVILSRRVGLFHDIGKSVDDEGGYSHVLSGVSLAKKYNEPEEVINAIASHHRDEPVNNIYSSILLAADKISAARPGARGYQLEAYVERMNSIEKIAESFHGIKKSYSFQSGREI
jgi:ribonuclease Y